MDRRWLREADRPIGRSVYSRGANSTHNSSPHPSSPPRLFLSAAVRLPHPSASSSAGAVAASQKRCVKAVLLAVALFKRGQPGRINFRPIIPILPLSPRFLCCCPTTPSPRRFFAYPGSCLADFADPENPSSTVPPPPSVQQFCTGSMCYFHSSHTQLPLSPYFHSSPSQKKSRLGI